MKNLCFIIQGVTFLKSVVPLIVFSNNQNIKPVIFCIKHRAGKPYDNLINKSDKIHNLIKKKNINCDIFWCDNQKQALDYMLHNNLENIVCQDAHGHGRIFCENEKIKVFSIGVFFDTLHHANDLRLKRIKYNSFPNVVYFPNKKFKNEFCRIYKNYPAKMRSLGSPIFDHTLFIDKKPRKTKTVTFLVTLQKLITNELQSEIEDFIDYCYENNIKFQMKTKPRTPWKFKNQNTVKNITLIQDELGFPATSINLICNSDIIISSYSTCAVEADYFGVPCINLDSVDQKSLTYAVNSIKYDYDFDNFFNSDYCKTVSRDITSIYEKLIQLKVRKKETLSLENNNSIRILKDISTFL